MNQTTCSPRGAGSRPANDPFTIVSSVVFVALMASIAVVVPAWQAVRVDLSLNPAVEPSQVLRDQA